jgi:hypothetical protein
MMFDQLISNPVYRLERRRYHFEHLKAGKRLYVEKARVRSAAKALRLWINRRGLSAVVRERHVGRPCVWWEVTV